MVVLKVRWGESSRAFGNFQCMQSNTWLWNFGSNFSWTWLEPKKEKRLKQQQAQFFFCIFSIAEHAQLPSDRSNLECPNYRFPNPWYFCESQLSEHFLRQVKVFWRPLRWRTQHFCMEIILYGDEKAENISLTNPPPPFRRSRHLGFCKSNRREEIAVLKYSFPRRFRVQESWQIMEIYEDVDTINPGFRSDQTTTVGPDPTISIKLSGLHKLFRVDC